MPVDVARIRALMRIAEEMGQDIGLLNEEADTAEAFINLANCVPVLVREIELQNKTIDHLRQRVAFLQQSQWISDPVVIPPVVMPGD